MSRKREHPPLVVVPGWGGWAEATWHRGEPDEVVAYVRLELGPLPVTRVRVVELRIAEPWVRNYRELPVGRIEAAVGADAATFADLSAHLDRELPQNDPAEFFATKKQIAGRPFKRYRLKRPTSRRLPDSFYRQVADAYQDAVFFGLNPRKVLADDAETPADTVARWVTTARKRGHLPPARPGRVSA